MALAYTDAKALTSDSCLDDFEPLAITDEPLCDRREFHEGVAAAGREVVERPLDLVVGVHPHPCGSMLGDESVGNRLARVPLLHAYDQACKVVDPVHVRVAAGVEDERL